MAEMQITTLYPDGVTTVDINDAPADIIQDIWTALKTGKATFTFDE